MEHSVFLPGAVPLIWWKPGFQWRYPQVLSVQFMSGVSHRLVCVWLPAHLTVEISWPLWWIQEGQTFSLFSCRLILSASYSIDIQTLRVFVFVKDLHLSLYDTSHFKSNPTQYFTSAVSLSHPPPPTKCRRESYAGWFWHWWWSAPQLLKSRRMSGCSSFTELCWQAFPDVKRIGSLAHLFCCDKVTLVVALMGRSA